MKVVNSREEYLKQLSLESGIGYCSFAELGVYHGDFSEMILKTIKPSWLCLVDPYKNGVEKYNNGLSTQYSTDEDYDKLIKRFPKEILKGQISVYKMPSYNAVSCFPDLYFDFIYHDASHLKEDVKRDLWEWLPKLKLDGVMCGHDMIEHEDFGVIDAVEDFCNQFGFKIFLYNKNGGDYALKRI